MSRVRGLALSGPRLGSPWPVSVRVGRRMRTTVINQRQDLMKNAGQGVGARSRASLDGKGDLAAAQAAGAELVRTTAQSRPVSAGHRHGRVPRQNAMRSRNLGRMEPVHRRPRTGRINAAEALNAALQSGDKAAITAAFERLGKTGCGGCHTPFREPKPKT